MQSNVVHQAITFEIDNALHFSHSKNCKVNYLELQNRHSKLYKSNRPLKLKVLTQKLLVVWNESHFAYLFRASKNTFLFALICKYSSLPITRTPANSNQSRFPLDFLHTFTVILPSVTRTLDNSNLPPIRSNFCFPSDHFYIILPSITWTML